ncbi:hypothetical protein SLS57_012083 [Botryosphaeria dothidea]
MVYCGPPSRGCETCRKRKIRCDQQPLPAGCTQCSRAKRQCPGYRDLQQVLFRNESAKVEKRVRTTSARKKHSSTARDDVQQLATPASSGSAAPFSDLFVDDSPSTAALVVQRPSRGNPGASKLNGAKPLADTGNLYALVSSPDDRAAGFFFSNFCNYVVFSAGNPVASTGAAADLWSCEIDEHLYTSMKAVGLVGLYRQSHNPEFEKLAWKRYLEAIQRTNEALRSPQMATKDSSLLAVIILGLFESISGRGRESLVAWENHINGAAALISMRGRRQLETAVGRRMLMQITSNLLISCIQRDIVFPEPIKDLMDEAIKDHFVDRDNPLYRLREIMMDFANFRAHWRNRAVWDCRAIVDRSLELDAELVSLQDSLPPSWRYRTVPTDDDPDIIVNGYYHVYPGYWQAQVWNSMRTCRLLLYGMMRKALLTGFSATPPAFANEARYTTAFADCTRILYALQAEVQASVPQHIGYLSAVRQREKYSSASSSPTSTDSSSSSSSSSLNKKPLTGLGSLLAFPWSDFDMRSLPDDPHAWQLASTHIPIVRSYGSTLLLWTLYLVGNQEVTTRKTQEWMEQVLAHIGEAMGLRQANVLADLLGEKMDAEDRAGGRPEAACFSAGFGLADVGEVGGERVAEVRG